ncbi:ribonuclease domain-containing protein [Actinomycetospora corticicola]|uniref:Guanyl-specific ribonuclease Sa n=1 Tax=Actinomycetospora corticicola TaxID=663602 RepID=A0A7Y9J8F0_9PSEU|nr:ribonuclease domain-containing protein [Actinomycetospora corticicola]NYD39036.1 guanyl-specific ribonuclease Sa [Actinomycetospora corticicola]
MRAHVMLVVLALAGLIGLLPAAACAGPVAPAVGTVTSVASAVPGADSGLPVRALSSLPTQAGDTVRLIRRGGPYPSSRDGIVFGNRERLLPAEASGYYHEYTVPTPGSSDRGARRIVTGAQGEYYYTGDHYGSFVVVDVSQ